MLFSGRGLTFGGGRGNKNLVEVVYWVDFSRQGEISKFLAGGGTPHSQLGKILFSKVNIKLYNK